MSVETAPYINSLDAALPTNAQLKSEGDDHIRAIKGAIKATFPNLTGPVNATQAELNHVVGVTAPIQTQIDQATALATSQAASASSATSLTIGTGDKSFTMQAGRNLIAGQVQLSISSTASPANWMTGTLTSYDNATGAAVVTVTNTGGSGTFAAWTIGVIAGAGMSGLVNELKGADIASAASINLDNATGNLVHITGTAAISAMTLAAGRRRTLVFDGACTLTHSATLKCPGDSSIVTAAGDMVTVYGDGSGAVLLTDYITKSGKPLTSGAFIFTSSGTFTPPAGATTVIVDLFGAGGGGGSGMSGAAGTDRPGGGGGGGGAHVRLVIAASAIAGAVSVLVGAGGAGGAAVNATSGNPGTAGGYSAFGSYGAAYGGGGGRGGTTGGLAGGGGGGGGAAGAGASGGSTGDGGLPNGVFGGTSATGKNNIGGGGASGSAGASGAGCAEWGGGGGGGSSGTAAPGAAAGSSVFGGGGGGAGGSVNAANATWGGTDGGATQSYAVGGGTNGVDLNGGKGGAPNAAGNGSAGVAGGMGAGGGGGGGASGTSGAGGAGGRGEVRVYWF